MERYAEKMRQRKLKGGKKKIAGEVLREEEMDQAAEKWIVKINAASSAIAQRWLRKAQDSITAKFKAKGDQLRTDVERTVNAMPAEDDWFFGAALREEGQAPESPESPRSFRKPCEKLLSGVCAYVLHRSEWRQGGRCS